MTGVQTCALPILAEIQILEEDTPAVMQINGTEVEFTTVLLPRYEVIYNPTAIVEAVGLLLFAGGTIALMVNPPVEDNDRPAPSQESEEA